MYHQNDAHVDSDQERLDASLFSQILLNIVDLVLLDVLIIRMPESGE